MLFADVKGSLELLGERDPEEAEQILSLALDHMLEAVHRYDGTVNQVLGDGIMALFGAPIAHEDHAARACYAALRMQERVAAWSEELRRERGLPIQIRVGLNAGEVVVRSIGSDLHMAYTVVGPTVHLAARMEQAAEPGSILATVQCVRLAGEGVLTRPLGPVRVKGLVTPVEVHEILGARRGRGRSAVTDDRTLAPFVGRAAELGRLDAVLEAVRAGQAHVVAVVGEAGVGKSRLCHEFLRRARSAGCLVLETAAVSYSRAMAHSAALDLLQRFFDVTSQDDVPAARAKVAARLMALDPTLEASVPAVLWLLGMQRQGSPFLSLESSVRWRRATEATRRMLAAEGQHRPVVILIEDFLWADSQTQATVTALGRALPAGVLLAVNYRTGGEDGWGDLPGYVRLELVPLQTHSASDLVRALVGSDPSLRPLEHALVERTGGNPLFLEECVRNLVETGALVGAAGHYRLARPEATVEVPATVRAVLEARIDRLPGRVKRVLQAASVIGEEVPASLVEAIADVPAEEVRASLATLVDAGLLAELALFPDPIYAFRHSLIHDMAYSDLLHERRRALHAAVVRALEERGPAELAGQLERLAHHAFRGELWERAVRYLREAAAATRSRLALRDALALYQRALEALAHLPQRDETRQLAVDLRLELRNALVPLGEHTRLRELLEETLRLAEALGDQRRVAQTLALLCNTHWNLGTSREAVAAGRRALAIAERLEALDLQVVGNLSLGAALRALGDYPAAIDRLRRNVALLGPGRERETFGLAGFVSALSRGHLAWSLAELGEFDEATAFAEEAIELARAAGHTYSLAHAYLGLGGALLRQGRFGGAMAALERGLPLTDDVPVLFPPLAADLAVVYALSGRPGRAVELAENAVGGAERMERRGRLSLLVTHAGEVALLCGLPQRALERAEWALELARHYGERGNEVYALRLLGLLAAEREPPAVELARARFHDAATLARELGMRPLLARCHLGLGRLARRLGDGAAAASHLETASELFRAMTMTFWLERLHLDRISPPTV